MANQELRGGCHCGRIQLNLNVSWNPATYSPRACDCTYCRAHNAAYLSDPAGRVVFTVNESGAMARYRHGDQLADFLFCRHCGVLLGVTFLTPENRFAAVNVHAVEHITSFAPPLTVSPQKLSGDQKRERWPKLWFADVEIND